LYRVVKGLGILCVLPQEGDETVDQLFGYVEDAEAGKVKDEVRVSAVVTMVQMSEVRLLVALCLRFVVRWRIE
jgi:hypothetical protein